MKQQLSNQVTKTIDVLLEDINPEKSARLVELERTIKAGMETFLLVGTALQEIRDSKLYRIEHTTFEDYCRVKWGISRIHAHRLIEAGQVAAMLPIGNKGDITAESQARELVGVPVDQRAEVINKAKEKTGGKVTATAIREVRNEVLPPEEKTKRVRKPNIALNHKVVVNTATGEILSIEKCQETFSSTSTLCVVSEADLHWQLNAVTKKSFASKVCKAIRDHERNKETSR